MQGVHKLPVMESFYSIQGEGFHQGKAACFLRLAGCDVGCVWCDVKDSWPTEGYPELSVEELVHFANGHNSDIVIITGGEPLMYDLTSLTRALQATGKKTHVETSGVYGVSGVWDWICFSPKKFKAPQEKFFTISHELKIVIYHPSDFKWAEGLAAKMNNSAKLYLQPEWSKSKEITPLIIEYVKQNPHWEISLQIHKFMDIP